MTRRDNPKRLRALAGAALAAGALTLTGTVGAAAQSPRHDDETSGTFIYTEDNAAASAGGNAVHAFRLGPGGALAGIGSFATGGDGSGSGLGSQGAVTLTGDGHALLAVNAGSNSVTLFRVEESGALTWVAAAPSGGTDPISIAAYGRLVEVLNAGSNAVAGLALSGQSLNPISGATAALSAGAAAPVQVGFAPDGKHVVVAEKVSNTIDTFEVSHDRLVELQTTASTGATPFGFDFTRHGDLIVSDAAGGAPGASAATSYRVDDDGGLHPISEVGNGQSAACWLVVNRNGTRAYVANTGSGTVSAYDITGSGKLTLRAGAAATPGGHPIDEALGGGWLFVLIGQAIAATPVLPNGDLGAVTVTGGLPAGTTGLAALALA
ncbi:MAG: lactonase family protein [Chloroflexi bacterium]|nr:MAG: lactonase family protein [Chloroflexota bacterium]